MGMHRTVSTLHTIADAFNFDLNFKGYWLFKLKNWFQRIGSKKWDICFEGAPARYQKFSTQALLRVAVHVPKSPCHCTYIGRNEIKEKIDKFR